MKLANPFSDGFIPNHPDIRTNTLTHTIAKASTMNLEKEDRGYI
jgi:hypothetical protein